MNPDISIIIPVYNGDKYISNCLNMVLSQNGNNFEVIVINDGSTDNTENEIQSFLPDSRIIYYKQQNKGVSAARNKGMELSNGKWIVFVDADDEVLPGYIENITRETKANPDADLFIYARWKCSDDNYSKSIAKGEDLISTHFGLSKIPDRQDYYIPCVWSKVFSRRIIETADIKFDTLLTMSEDEIFMFKIFAACDKIVLIHRGFYKYVQNEDSAVHAGGKEQDKEGFKKIVEMLFYMKENLYNSEFWNAIGDDRISDLIFSRAMVMLGRVRRGTRNKNLKYRVRALREMTEFTSESTNELSKPKLTKQLKNKSVLKLKMISLCTPLYIILKDKSDK